MANLKELRNRISSVSSTMQITSAMKMVAAAKLNKAQSAILAMRPYADKLTELLQSLSSSMDDSTQTSVYAKQREVNKILVVAVASNRGLAGAFNTNVVKSCKQLLAQNEGAGKQVDFVTIGKKVDDIFSKTHQVISNHNALFDDLSYDNVAVVAQQLMDLFTTQAYDQIILVYNSFKNAGTQIVIQEQLLPIVANSSDDSKDNQQQKNASVDYIYEPSKQKIIENLIPKSLKMQFYKAIRDSFASEHGARMTAMHKATDNATELRNSLKLSYNKARQAAITNEILEIVGGAEALNN